MVKLPAPPSGAALSALGVECVRLPAGTALARIFFRGGDHPVRWNEFRFWGPGSGRFDHHLPDAKGGPWVQSRGIFYAAAKGRLSALAVCAAEVFQETRVINRARNDPWFVVFATTRDITVLDLTGAWPTRAGASAAIATGSKIRARQWSRAIYDAFPGVEGLLYPSSMGGNAPAFALYERATDALSTVPSFHRPLADPVLLAPLEDAAERIGYLVL